MPLVATTMRDAIIAAVNAKTWTDPNTGESRQMFNVQASPENPPYVFLNAACAQFVTLWPTVGLDMQPGTGPPPPAPPGTYTHAHTMLGTTLSALVTAYKTAIKAEAISSGLFTVGQGGWEVFMDAWAQGLLQHVDSAELATIPIDGAVAHTHTWLSVPTGAVIAAAVISLLPVTPPSGGYPFFVQELVLAAAQEFSRAIQSDSLLAPALGPGHIHVLS